LYTAHRQNKYKASEMSLYNRQIWLVDTPLEDTFSLEPCMQISRTELPRDILAHVISAKYFSIPVYDFLHPILPLLILHGFIVKLYSSLCTSFCFFM